MNYSEYVPGVCNIGPAEIAARKRLGWGGLILAVVFEVSLLSLDAGRPWRLTLFFPAVACAIGFLQGKMRFCVSFGMRHLFNFGPHVGKTESVTQEEFRARDRRKSWEIIGYSLMIATLITLALYLV